MPEEYAPPVVAVVVTRDPGPSLEECLTSLERQDYANLDVLVVDDASAADPTARIAARLPRAVIRRRSEPGGVALCANQALHGVEGATFFLICHDDVALAPDAVRRLVEEAFRSNAGVVGPKVVSWDDAGQLLHVGLSVNRFGSPDARVDAGERDQSQHDEVREVFAVPAGCQLVRVDLFAALGGLDEEMGRLGEDVDLCWRAQVAGARVVVAPRSVVRHLEASRIGERTAEPTAADSRDELRAVLKNYGRVRGLLTVLAVLVAGVAQAASGAFSPARRRAHARTRGRWRWNLAHRSSLSEARVQMREARTASDSEVVARMAGTRHRRFRAGPGAVSPGAPLSGGADLSGRPRVGFGDLARGGTSRYAAWRSADLAGTRSSRTASWLVLAFAVLLGVRGLLAGHLPLVGDLVPMPTGTRLIGEFFSGRIDPGWHHRQAAPPAYLIVGLMSLILGNSSALALKVLLVGGFVVGALGMARLVSGFGSSRVKLAAAVAFVASPVVWSALGHGDLQACAAVAAMPFVFRRLAVAARLAPFAPDHAVQPGSSGSRGTGGSPGTNLAPGLSVGVGGSPSARSAPRSRLAVVVGDVAPLGLLLAVAGSLAPAILLDTGTVAVAVLVASLAAGEARGALRSLAVAIGGAGVAFVCTLPWSALWLDHGSWSLFSGALVSPAATVGPSELLRGGAGSVGESWVAWGLVAAAGFALFASRGTRLRWAARWWLAVAGSAGFAWVASQGWVGPGGSDTLVFLAPLAVGVAACCGLGVAAFEADLAGYRFGWRQALSFAAAACFVGGLLPGAAAALGGRGGLPAAGVDQILGWMGSESSGSGASVATAGSGALASGGAASAPGWRTLWLGDPRVLPGRSWQVMPGLAAFTTLRGLPGVSVEWPAPSVGPGVAVSAALRHAESGMTLQLGADLARFGVRYIVVPSAAAPTIPGEQSPALHAAPPALLGALAAQSDLRELPVEAGIVAYENAAWVAADGAGITATQPGTSTALRAAGLAAALLVAIACVVEGVIRRRRVPRARVAGWPQHGLADALDEPGSVGPRHRRRAGPAASSPSAVGPASTDVSGPSAGGTRSRDAAAPPGGTPESPVLQGAD